MRYFLILLFNFLIITGLTACGSSAPVLKPYKMEIQQGNVVTSKMLLQLRPGMTKSQVRFIMGTPLIVDSFHNNRWDYFYQLRQSGKVVEQRRVILDFENELLARVRGDVVPVGTVGVETIDAAQPKTVTVPQKAEKEEGFLDKLKFWKKDEAAAKPEEAKPAEVVSPIVAPADSAEVGDSKETPSVLAVPAAIGAAAEELPVIESPNAEQTKQQWTTETTQQEVPEAQAATAETQKNEPAAAEPIVMEEPAPIAPVIVPEKAEQVVTQPESPALNTEQGERLIFRLDRTLDSKLLEQEMAPKPAAPVVEKVPMPKKPPVDDKPLPPEAEPGYFERMLEKIGF